MRDFLIRRLRRVPVVERLWDEFEAMQAARDKAFAERDLAQADRAAALAERDAAVAGRDAARFGRYLQLPEPAVRHVGFSP